MMVASPTEIVQLLPSNGVPSRPIVSIPHPRSHFSRVVARFGPTTPTRAGRLADASVDPTAPGGIFATIILEIIGSVVGGFLGTLFGFGDTSGFDPRSMALPVGGGIVVLLIYRLVAKGRA
jgi:uncharacterized membrane protein YeaQ/YmgE (transglycosylase-associated protein family)